MSVGRIVIAIGIGLVSAVVYTFFKNREEHNNQQHRSGSGRGSSYSQRRNDNNESGQWEGIPPSWKEEQSQDNGETSRKRKGETFKKGCTICLTSFDKLNLEGIPIWSTPCGHLYCLPCLQRCLRNSPLCPTCRDEIQMRNCHKIYL